VFRVKIVRHGDWISDMRKGEEFNMSLRFLFMLIEWKRRYKGRSRLMEELNIFNFRSIESDVPVRTKVDYLALSENLGVISVDEREKCME